MNLILAVPRNGQSVGEFFGTGLIRARSQRNDYFRVRYLFPDGWLSEELTFCLAALLTWLRIQGKEPPNRLVLLGTGGSLWDGILAELGDLSRPALCGGFLPSLTAAVDRQDVTSEQVRLVARNLEQKLAIEVRAHLIPRAQSQEDQLHLLRIIRQSLSPGDSLTLDVTHGYRHLPMLVLGAARLIRRVDESNIENLFYAALDMRQGGEPAPVISLAWLLELSEWADVLRELRVGGRLRALPSLIKDRSLRQALNDTGFYLARNQVSRAGKAAMNCLKSLSATQSDPLLDLTGPVIQQIPEGIACCQRDPRRILQLARAALKEGDYVSTAILLNEAAIAQVGTSKFPEGDKLLATIRHLRNGLAHAAPARSLQGVLSSPATLEQTPTHQAMSLEQIFLKSHKANEGSARNRLQRHSSFGRQP